MRSSLRAFDLQKYKSLSRLLSGRGGGGGVPLLWGAQSTTPDSNNRPRTGPWCVGFEFTVPSPLDVYGLRFQLYNASDLDVHLAIWDLATTTKLVSTDITDSIPAQTWIHGLFASPLKAEVGTTYVATYFVPDAHQSREADLANIVWRTAQVDAVTTTRYNNDAGVTKDTFPATTNTFTLFAWLDLLIPDTSA